MGDGLWIESIFGVSRGVAFGFVSCLFLILSSSCPHSRISLTFLRTMARFRAYSSSEDESEPEPEPQPIPHQEEPIQIDDDSDEELELELEEESDEDSSSSELHEDDLLSSPSRRVKRPRRNALVEDEDGEIHYAHEMEASKSPPPVNGINRDPTVIPWAQQIGIDAQKMHLMQASLFRVPEQAAALKAMNANQPPQRHIRFQVPKQSRNRKHGRDSDGDTLRFEPREVCAHVSGFEWRLTDFRDFLSVPRSHTTWIHYHTGHHASMHE